MFNLGYEVYSLIRPKIPWSTEELQLHHRQPMDRENHWLWRISILRGQETLLRQENGGIQRLSRVILDTSSCFAMMRALSDLMWLKSVYLCRPIMDLSRNPPSRRDMSAERKSRGRRLQLRNHSPRDLLPLWNVSSVGENSKRLRSSLITLRKGGSYNESDSLCPAYSEKNGTLTGSGL